MGVVENLDSTPSSQLRAFWRETSGAAETRSVPTETEAKARDRRFPATDFIIVAVDRFIIAEAMARNGESLTGFVFSAAGCHCRPWSVVFIVINIYFPLNKAMGTYGFYGVQILHYF